MQNEAHKELQGFVCISHNNHFLLTIGYICHLKNPTVSKSELSGSVPILTK